MRVVVVFLPIEMTRIDVRFNGIELFNQLR
jgi:hypothetical protein